MTAEMAIPSSETTKPQKVLYWVALLPWPQSAWMGFALASDVLEQLWLAPAGILRRIQVIRPGIPRDISLKNLLTREYSVGEASFILMASFFFSAALGAVRQVLFNAQFGVSQQANAYYAAFRLPDTLFSLIAGGALSSAMIPVLLNARQKEGEAAGWRLISVVLTSLLAVFALLIVAVEIFTPALVTRVLAPGFDAETSDLTVTLTRIMLIQPMILLLGSVATAVLNSRNQFLLTGLSVVSHNVSSDRFHPDPEAVPKPWHLRPDGGSHRWRDLTGTNSISWACEEKATAWAFYLISRTSVCARWCDC